MSDNQRIIELERKVLELGKLREKCTLTNDIKISLTKYIESNEEFKKNIEEKIDENNKKQNIDKKSWWEYFVRPIPAILYILLVWFMVSNITDKVIEYNKTNKTSTTTQVTPNAK